MPMKRFDIDLFASMLDEVDTFGELRAACVDFFSLNRVRRMSYHHLPPPGASDYDSVITVVAEGFPEWWVKKYVENRWYEIDPIPKAAASRTEPMWWSEAATLPDLSEDALFYLGELKKAELGDGLAIPVFGPHGRDGYCGIGFGMAEPELDRFGVIRAQWMCQMAHQKYCDLLSEKSGDDITLSKREREILAWVARGKSNSVIADIIGISSNTVDTYLRRVFVKLKVADRVTAALRGLALGLVQ